jgi:hypothetical protein
MVSVGDRTHLSNYTYRRLSAWASLHGYSSMLIKENIVEPGVALHFNKLIAHRLAPGFKRYIIVDDDLLLRKSAPPMEDVPEGFVGLSPDAIQTNTAAPHVTWTGNTGFIVADSKALELLEEAYKNGEYPYNFWDNSGKGIWGPYDQAALNNVVFSKARVYQLSWKWNYQTIIDFYGNGKGWHCWQKHRWYRLWYYLSVFLPLPTRSRRLVKTAYGLHMTMGTYPKFFSIIHK